MKNYSKHLIEINLGSTSFFLSVCFFIFWSCTLSAQNIIYQEEFDGGMPADWTNNPISPENPDLKWEWTADGTAADGAYWLDRPGIISPSLANGCVKFDSDYYHSGGSASTWGAGPIPGDHTIEFISPVIDCSNGNNLLLKFNQYFRPNNAIGYVSVSGDAGATWTDFTVNEEIGGNIPTEHYDVRFADISAIADNNPDVQIKFIFEGRGFFWLLDDVVIVEKPDNQVDLISTIRPPFYGVPKSQLQAFDLGGEVCNHWGNLDQSDLTFNMTWNDSNNNMVFSGEKALDNLEVDSCAIIELDEAFDASDLPVETYSITSTISSASPNAFNTNNYIDEFMVTDSTYQKAHAFVGEGATAGSLQPAWEAGYSFPIISEGIKVYNIESTFAGFVEEASVVARLYEVTNPDLSTLVIDELVQIGAGSAELDDGELLESGYVSVNFEMFDFNTFDAGVALEKDKEYLVMVGTDDAPFVFVACGYEIDYKFSNPSIVVVNGDLLTGGFGDPRIAPHIAVHLRDESISSEKEVFGKYTINLFPNPAVESANLYVELPEVAQELKLNLVGLDGRLLKSWKYENIQDAVLPINTSSLTSGEYMLLINADGFRKSIPLVVKK